MLVVMNFVLRTKDFTANLKNYTERTFVEMSKNLARYKFKNNSIGLLK